MMRRLAMDSPSDDEEADYETDEDAETEVYYAPCAHEFIHESLAKF